MAYEKIEGDAGDNEYGGLAPNALDQEIRHAITLCWMMLPAERRNTTEVRKEIYRILDRAFRDLSEDEDAFRQ